MNLKIVLMASLLLTSSVITGRAESPQSHHLMPVPATVRFQSGRLALPSAFTVATKGHTDDRLRGGIDRMARRLEAATGQTYARGAAAAAVAADAATATLVVECQGPGAAVPKLGEDESYTLDVSATQATLRAPTVVGALRGLETFLQLVEGGRDGSYLPCVSIQDAPRFKWRGLMIDSARHFQPLDVIKRNLDGMAAVKMNVLHWHLTEDQGFRVESKKFPELTGKGSDGLFYTQEQIRDIIAYARDRGIRVVPEFDMPGHATSWVVSHPELASAPGPYEIERGAGIFDPTLDPTREETYKFLDVFLTEMAALFPDEYMHIGGDENNGKQWDANPKIQAFKKEKGLADNHALQAYFNQRILKVITRNNKRMMGWDEILHPDMPKNAVIQSWRGPAGLAAAASTGYDVLLSNGYYIDLMYPASQHYANDPLPANSPLTPEQATHVLGGEATMWSEYVSPETIDSRIWPRTAAIAERLWSPREVNDVADMYRRLAVVSVQLEALGLTHERNVDMLLRRMARSNEIGPLRTLVSVVEPVKEYRRGQQFPTTMLSPLTSLVDAARADSAEAREVSAMVDAFVADAPRYAANRERIVDALSRWRDARLGVDPIAARSPILKPHAPLAADLSSAGAIGLEAMAYLSAGAAPPAGWAEASLARLDEAAKPKAALELVIVPSVRRLVTAAAAPRQ